jgi:hypothetical protein
MAERPKLTTTTRSELDLRCDIAVFIDGEQRDTIEVRIQALAHLGIVLEEVSAGLRRADQRIGEMGG